MKTAACHSPGAQNFEVIPRFLKTTSKVRIT